jgi:hypothetical protein
MTIKLRNHSVFDKTNSRRNVSIWKSPRRYRKGK